MEPIAYGALELRPWELGRLTPGELLAMLDGYRWRREQEARDRVEAAWLNEYFHRQKRLRGLDHYLKPQTLRQEEKTADERRQEYEELRALLG